MLLEGHQLGHYRLMRQIGSGGMGTIFLAEDAHMPRQVAVKVVRTGGDDMPHTQEAAQRMLRSFQREMRAIVQLDHPHILPVFDFGQETVGEATYTYLVMLYRPEGSLSDWLRQPQNAQRISLADAAEWFTQAAQALQHAHTRGIVHQDVKPSNFLVRVDTAHPEVLPELLLADFGIARFSSTTTTQSQSHNVRGTPMFMSPEQWDGKPLPASDQYALAIMAFHLLTGRFPFQGTLGQIMHHHYMAQPPAPSSLNTQLNTAIDHVILRALAKEPGQRFPDILAFAKAFSQAVREAENLQHMLIIAHALDGLASPLRSEQRLTVSIIAESKKPNVPAEPPASQAQTPALPLDEPTATVIRLPSAESDDRSNVTLEDDKLTASAHVFRGNDDPTFLTPPRPTSSNDAPTPAALTLTRLANANAQASDDPNFIAPTHPANIKDAVEIPTVLPAAPLTSTPLVPITQATPTVLSNQQQGHAVNRRYSPWQKGLVLVLLALIILAGSGILLYKGLVSNKYDDSHAQLSITTQTIHTSKGNITVIIVTTVTHTAGQTSAPTSGSTNVPGAGAQATATSTSGSGTQPTSTPTSSSGSQPTPTPTPIPPTATPTPVPGCTISSWSLTLRSGSNGGTVFYVTPYCNRTVWLRFTQAPSYTTDLQVCFGSADCSGWTSTPSTNIGTWFAFFTQISVGAGFTINARCHGGGSCPSTYTVYGQARY